MTTLTPQSLIYLFPSAVASPVSSLHLPLTRPPTPTPSPSSRPPLGCHGSATKKPEPGRERQREQMLSESFNPLPVCVSLCA